MTSEKALTEQTQELLDLYVAGCLEPEEVLTAEELLAHSDAAQAYVDEGRAMFAGHVDDAPSSPELLTHITAQIDFEKEMDNVVPLQKNRSLFVPFIAGAVAASLLAVTIGAAIWPSKTAKSSQEAFSLKQHVKEFAAAENTQTVSLTNAGGTRGATVMMHPEGDIMIDATTLKTLNKDATYQLWAVMKTVTGNQVVSAGVLGNRPGVYMVRVHGDITAFVITKEVNGGVEKSSQNPLYSAKVA